MTIDVLADIIRPSFYAPHGYGLKTLAPAVGAQWRSADADGKTALLWIHEARTGGDTWDTLVAYNEDDVKALHQLRYAIADAAVGSVLTRAAP
jgi:predicted RecB family nuclease